MSTIGSSELVILALMALVLFGTPVLTFALGYVIGRRSGSRPDGPAPGGGRTAPPEESPL